MLPLPGIEPPVASVLFWLSRNPFDLQSRFPQNRRFAFRTVVRLSFSWRYRPSPQVVVRMAAKRDSGRRHQFCRSVTSFPALDWDIGTQANLNINLSE
jgi:hypothetical protein